MNALAVSADQARERVAAAAKAQEVAMATYEAVSSVPNGEAFQAASEALLEAEVVYATTQEGREHYAARMRTLGQRSETWPERYRLICILQAGANRLTAARQIQEAADRAAMLRPETAWAVTAA